MFYNPLLETLQTVGCLSVWREERRIADRTGPTEFHPAHIKADSLITESSNFNPSDAGRED